MKKCIKCKLEKTLEEFPKRKGNRDGHAGMCYVCDNARKRAHDAKKREENPELFAQIRRQYSKDWSEKNREKRRETDRKVALKRKFGITVEQYDGLLEAQRGMCLTCDAKPTDKRLAVDHDHNCCPGQKTCGKCIRGLLCSNCNTALGLIKERQDVLYNMLQYLRGHKET
jgi:hypothetical protein